MSQFFPNGYVLHLMHKKKFPVAPPGGESELAPDYANRSQEVFKAKELIHYSYTGLLPDGFGASRFSRPLKNMRHDICQLSGGCYRGRWRLKINWKF